MKNLIPILFVMMVVGCGKSDVEGTYQMETSRFILLKNGAVESFHKGKNNPNRVWSKIDGEVHINMGAMGKARDYILVLKIEGNGNLTAIANIIDGNREDFPKESQYTAIKVI